MDAASGETPLSRFLAGQTLTQLRALKAQYREEMETTRQRAEVLEHELERIEQVIQDKSGGKRKAGKPAAHVKLSGNGAARRTEPALREVILSVMHHRAGTWTKREIYDELDKIGRAPKGRNPTNALGNRLLEMAARGEVKRAGRGAYELLRGPHDEEPVGTVPGARDKGSEEGASRPA